MIDDILNRLLVVEDHQRFLAVLAGRLFAEPDEPFGLKDIVGVPFHAR